MIRDFKVAAIALSIFAGVTTNFACAQTVLPSDDAIRKILVERVGENEKDIGVIVGLIDPQSRRMIAHGHRNAGDPRPLDGDTVFEIGSMTKVFTALLLADMVAKTEVALSDPVSKYLPAAVRVPERNSVPLHLSISRHTPRVCRSCRKTPLPSTIRPRRNIRSPISKNIWPHIS